MVTGRIPTIGALRSFVTVFFNLAPFSIELRSAPRPAVEGGGAAAAGGGGGPGGGGGGGITKQSLVKEGKIEKRIENA